jgi:phenylpyruvate tautomerase PptA (4-oxalocrotonate tautomerase family)
MPVIIVKARETVVHGAELKARLIKEMAAAFARAVGDEAYASRATVLIETLPDESWGRGGKPVES